MNQAISGLEAVTDRLVYSRIGIMVWKVMKDKDVEINSVPQN